MSFGAFFEYPGDAVPATSAPDAAVLLPELDDSGWNTLISYMQVSRFAQGDVIVAAGTYSRSLSVVADGIAVIETPDGAVAVETGAVLGEVPFFDGRPHDATIRARTDVDLLALSPEAFDVLAAREPLLARTLLFDLGRILALRLRQALVKPGG